MSKRIVQVLNEGERRLIEPHVEAVRRAQENLRIAVDALRKDPASSFEVDTLAYYREEPEPEK